MSIRFAILTVSDRSSAGERPDTSGPALAGLIGKHGWEVAVESVVPDEIEQIQDKLVTWADDGEVDVILTTGGTGFTPRDVTPEATRRILERFTPGLDEAMRAKSLEVTPHAMLSRAISGIRRQTLIINLPGSPKGAVENLEVVIPALEHAVKLLRNEQAGH